MKSEFTYLIRRVKGRDFIMIEDKDKGASVTNNIDWVVKQIAGLEGINPVEYTIIYKSTEGIWDGYIFSVKQFFPIRETHWLKAALKTIK